MMPLFVLLLEVQLILWLTVSSSSSSSQETLSIAKPHCVDDCGGVKIPYPFGVGANCSYDKFYEIFCNHSLKPPKPFLRYYNLEVTDIIWPRINETSQKLIIRAPPTSICQGKIALLLGVDLRGSPYRISNWFNVFLVEGCSGSVVMRNRSKQIVTGCASVCAKANASVNITTCHGVGCCSSPLLPAPTKGCIDWAVGSDFYEIVLDQTGPISPTNTCPMVAALIERGSQEMTDGRLSNSLTIPTVLEWNFTYMRNNEGKFDKVTCEPYGRRTDTCHCQFPYDGNPYVPNGCQVMPACQNCRHHCAYNHTGDYSYCEKNSWLKPPLILGFTVAMGLVFVVLGSYWLYRLIKWRREIRRKAKYFKKNGGLLLQQEISSSNGVIEKMTIFTITELEKATDNFHKNRVLGQGGQGTVYKGMLIDGRIVAIKKSTKVDEGQLDQFINEVVILSQINHQNVVKLLGCCLETEVPLLVYEFIPNGTLYEHIHYPTKDFHVTWKMRLQIAAESAGALAYLHSSSSIPIYHRDIKSSNILLDEKYRAKVSDFGTSRAINIEQTHVTTRVHGTYGYLDPEYFQSNQFTEKSDVYSFGVVLVELITGKKPFCPTESGGWKSLAIEFLSRMENSCAFDMVDARVIEEGKEEEFIAVTELARRCLNMNGKQRPTMKEVAMILDGIKSPNLKESNSVKGKCVVTEINDSGPSSTDMFFTTNGSFSSLFIDVQPLLSNTQ